MRKERGALELVQLKQLETSYKMSQKQREIQNKINVIVQQLQTNLEQLTIQRDISTNYQTLLVAENEKFRIGESSIFLLNSREQKLMEAQLKVAKTTKQLSKIALEIGMGRRKITIKCLKTSKNYSKTIIFALLRACRLINNYPTSSYYSFRLIPFFYVCFCPN